VKHRIAEMRKKHSSLFYPQPVSRSA
jgi:hypothetical protein